MRLLALALALAGMAEAAGPRGGAGPRSGAGGPVSEVVRSTAPLSAQPSGIQALKRQIGIDQDDVRRARAALKKARKGKAAAARAKAQEAWTQAKERLKVDRAVLRQAIEEREAERGAKLKAGDKSPKGEKPKS